MPKLVQVNWLPIFFSRVLSFYYFKPCEIAINRLWYLYRNLVSTCIGAIATDLNCKNYAALLVSSTGINVYWGHCNWLELQELCCATCIITWYQHALGHCNWHKLEASCCATCINHLVSTCIGPLQLTQIGSIMLRYLYHHLVSSCIGLTATDTNWKHHAALLVSSPDINVYWAISTDTNCIMLRYLYHHLVSSRIGPTATDGNCKHHVALLVSCMGPFTVARGMCYSHPIRPLRPNLWSQLFPLVLCTERRNSTVERMPLCYSLRACPSHVCSSNF
jgi:hypothetical protein